LHLPQAKQDQLQAIVGVIRKHAPAEIIVLFGSFARGDWVEDAKTGYRSDFDILVIVQHNAVAERDDLWNTVENRAQALPGMNTEVSLIVHDVKCVNKKLGKGQFFFVDIIKEGVVLYDSGRLLLAAPKEQSELSLNERREQASRDFRKWFESANEFYGQFESGAEKGWTSNAAFQLHQATERYYAAVLLVFSGYKPRIHNIEALGKMASNQHPGLRGIFPRSTPEEQRRFKLLKKAYIDARYNEHYRITAEELSWLGERVRLLRDRAEQSCLAKIDSFVAPEGGAPADSGY
jgi:HEPN domain-containing protein/predicted nucleotidyltransferase